MVIQKKATARRLRESPGSQAEDFVITPVEKGGSGRKFYRVRVGDRTAIMIRYSGTREENSHYVDIGKFLTMSGVQVPRVDFHDPAEGIVWMQDLGEADLWSFRGEPWDVRRPLYESALIELYKFHVAATRRMPENGGLILQREFDEELYLWEQGYFFEHCLRNHFLVSAEASSALAQLPALRLAAKRLAALPRVLVHRDFQSQNILVFEGSAWLIDFQGMRWGLAQYDLASLLYDPYVAMTAEEREELLSFYERLVRRSGDEVPADFRDTFAWCALQRLMQALGAYGFLGLQKSRADFLHHIPAARVLLRDVAAGLEGLDDLVSKLDTLV